MPKKPVKDTRKKTFTVQEMKAKLAREAKQDVRDIRQVPVIKRLEAVAGTIRMTEVEVQGTANQMKRASAPETSVNFAQGVHSGLRYAHSVARGASTGREVKNLRGGGYLLSRSGKRIRQRRGSVLR